MSSVRSKAWPRRGLFIGCIVLGVANLVALDVVFAPMLFDSKAEAADASRGGTR